MCRLLSLTVSLLLFSHFFSFFLFLLFIFFSWLLQPSSVEIPVCPPEDGEKDVASSLSQKLLLPAPPPTCWWDQERACVRTMALGVGLSLDA